MFAFGVDCPAVETDTGITRKVLAWSEELMMCEIAFEAGAAGKVHSHPHLQVTYVAEGTFAFTVDGETKTIHQGDSVYMPADAVHGVVALTAGKLIDVFNPKRDDFLS